MPSIMLGRESFTLPIGETRVGGAGDDALPFAALRRLPTVAVLLVAASETVSLWPVSNEAGVVTVNDVPVGAEPVPVTHGAKIEVAGVRLTFRDGREAGTTGPATALTREQFALPGRQGGAPEATTDARLVRRGGGTATIPNSGLVIGRDPDSDLVVGGMEVSRRHAVLRGSPRGYVLTDVSRNGIHVNGRRVEGSVVLHAGDVMRIGDDEFSFEVGGPRPDPAATPPAPPAGRLAEPPTALRSAARTWSSLRRFWRG
jgi:hypothetical protein